MNTKPHVLFSGVFRAFVHEDIYVVQKFYHCVSVWDMGYRSFQFNPSCKDYSRIELNVLLKFLKQRLHKYHDTSAETEWPQFSHVLTRVDSE